MKQAEFREFVERSWREGVGLRGASAYSWLSPLAEAGVVAGVQGGRARVRLGVGGVPGVVHGGDGFEAVMAGMEGRLRAEAGDWVPRVPTVKERFQVDSTGLLWGMHGWRTSVRKGVVRGRSTATLSLATHAVEGVGFPRKHAEKGRLEAMRREALDAWEYT